MTSKLPLNEVAYFNAEHSKFSVKNLLNGSGKWTTPPNSKLDKLEAEFSLGSPAKISGIDIGNFWTSSVEIVVGLSTWPQNKREVLLPNQIFMNRMHCMSGENKETMKFFRSKEHFSVEVASKKWDRVKIICQQPFRIESDIFGVSMFVLHGEMEKLESTRRSFTPVNASPLAKPPPSNGLEHFMKNKLDLLKPKNPKVALSGVLKSLENRNNLNENPGTSSPVSRSGKLVVSAQARKSNKNEKSFRKEALEFLENCGFSSLTFAEVEQVTFRKVKDSWKQKGGRELTKDEKESLKIISTDYLTKLLSGDGSNKRNFEDSEVADNPPKRRKMSDERIKMRKEVDIEDKKLSQDGSLRNDIATMDMDKDHEEELSNKSLEKKKERKKKTPEKVSSGAWIGKTSTPISVKTKSPISNKTKSPISNKTKSPWKASYNPSKLVDFSKEFLYGKGVLVQNYCYKKNKDLPLKNGLSLNVKKGTPVTFYKIGPRVHMETEGVFYKPDVQPEHLNSLFKDFGEDEIEKSVSPLIIEELFGKPVEPDTVDLIEEEEDSDDEFLKQFDNSELQIKVSDSDDDNEIKDDISNRNSNENGVHQSNRDEVQKRRQAFLDKLESKSTKFSQNSPKRSVESPISIQNPPRSPISIQSPPRSPISIQNSPRSVEKTKSPGPSQNCFGECPMCQMMLPMSELQDHAEACLGKPETPQKSDTSKCPICDKQMKISILEQHAAECGLGSRDNSLVEPERKLSVPASLAGKFGTCPVCDGRFWLDELDRHAALCCGTENGGDGNYLNEMDQQDRCPHCHCLVPSIAMEEHKEDCWQNTDTRKRVPTPAERRKSMADIKNRKQYKHLK